MPSKSESQYLSNDHGWKCINHSLIILCWLHSYIDISCNLKLIISLLTIFDWKRLLFCRDNWFFQLVAICCRYNRSHVIFTWEPNYTYEYYLVRLFVIFKGFNKIFIWLLGFLNLSKFPKIHVWFLCFECRMIEFVWIILMSDIPQLTSCRMRETFIFDI